MKKTGKAVLAVLISAVFLINLIPVRAKAVEENTAYLAYADAGWNISIGVILLTQVW